MQEKCWHLDGIGVEYLDGGCRHNTGTLYMVIGHLGHICNNDEVAGDYALFRDQCPYYFRLFVQKILPPHPPLLAVEFSKSCCAK